MSIKKKIFIFGIGYVGASLAYLLAKNNKVICFDIDKNKIDKIKNNEPPIPDKNLVNYIEESNLDITGLSSLPEHLNDQDFIIICTPTNFDENKNAFDTESITKIVKNLSLKTHFANIIIKSTVPIGFTRELQKKYKQFNILHSPEFLREGNALYDNQFPSRIVVGHIDSEDIALFFAKLLESLSKVNDVPIIIVSSDESESIKLFSNTYLAMRVAFFNEIDSFSMQNNLNARNVIDGMSLDKRIGSDYNNPSFGYGGYCLPKDSKQTLSSYSDTPQALIEGIVSSNHVRKNFIINTILKKKPKRLGVYRLVMKKDSENFRESAIIDIIKSLSSENIEIVVYEPLMKSSNNDFELINDLQIFIDKCDLIIANRYNNDLQHCKDKILCRDLYFKD